MSASLTPAQQAAVEDARAFSAAVDKGREALAAHIHSRPGADAVYAEATGWANSTIRDLLAIIDTLTGGAR